MLPVMGPSRRYPRRYRDGCPAPEYDRSWCSRRRKSWSYARAAAGKRAGIPGGGPPPVPGARASRSPALPAPSGPKPGWPAAAPFTAAPGSRPGPRRSPWSEALMTLRSSSRARLTPGRTFTRFDIFPAVNGGDSMERYSSRTQRIRQGGYRFGVRYRPPSSLTSSMGRRSWPRGLPFTETGIFAASRSVAPARTEAGQTSGNVYVT